MKRIWISLSLLAVVFCAALVNAHYLEGICTELIDLLTEAEVLAEQDDWAGAEELTQEVIQRWESKDVYFHTVLRHAEIDQVQSGLRQVHEFIHWQEGGEYSAANAQLMTQIELISQMEQLSIKNLL